MIIFTNLEYEPHERARLTACLGDDEVYFGDPEELSEEDREALVGAEVAFGSCPPELLERVAELTWLQLDSVGCDQYLSLDWATLGKRLTVTKLRDFFSVAVAETGIAGVLTLYRGIDRLIDLRAERTWRPVGLRGELRTLKDSEALIVGNGSVGRELKDRLSVFGCRVRTFGSLRSGADICSLRDLDSALGGADLVFLTLPETAATSGMFGRWRLGLLKQGAVLANLGRGGLVDEDALVEAASTGALSGAVIDVTAVEPLPPDSPLWTATNILLTQHTAGGSADEIGRKIDAFLANLDRYRAGLPLANLIDWEKGY